MYRMVRAFEKVGYALAGVILLAPFQNCGKFESTTTSMSSLAQCKAVYAKRALSRPGAARTLACDAASSFACERRVFGPGLTNQTQRVTECVADDFCVAVDVRTFDTEPARGEADPSAFN